MFLKKKKNYYVKLLQLERERERKIFFHLLIYSLEGHNGQTEARNQKLQPMWVATTQTLPTPAAAFPGELDQNGMLILQGGKPQRWPLKNY